ncbi:MAG TPA: dTDP-4-dehydrorhamnose reductase [Polyangiaceae bacterium]|nr:dTDP-4-dehydrorhamnose reductase [Polyangiaceae bacterium]
MKALITGGGGQLASDLVTLLGDSARVYSHAELDITDNAALDRAFEQTQPDVVFNCAAFHNVDVCEREPDAAWAVNVRAVRELARRGARLVHLSTNYVFDGRREQPYGEQDLPAPRSIYALTKLGGEYAALAYGDGALVVRSSGLYGLHGSASKGGNFVQRMIARAREQGALNVVADQHLQPTFTADLAQALLDALDAGASGLLHLTAAGACSWHEFTVAIMQEAGIDVPVTQARTEIPPGGVDRPLNGVLARTRADALGLAPLRGWREALADYMGRAGLAVSK